MNQNSNMVCVRKTHFLIALTIIVLGCLILFSKYINSVSNTQTTKAREPIEPTQPITRNISNAK